jgi:hypothetical protein
MAFCFNLLLFMRKHRFHVFINLLSRTSPTNLSFRHIDAALHLRGHSPKYISFGILHNSQNRYSIDLSLRCLLDLLFHRLLAFIDLTNQFMLLPFSPLENLPPFANRLTWHSLHTDTLP